MKHLSTSQLLQQLQVSATKKHLHLTFKNLIVAKVEWKKLWDNSTTASFEASLKLPLFINFNKLCLIFTVNDLSFFTLPRIHANKNHLNHQKFNVHEQMKRNCIYWLKSFLQDIAEKHPKNSHLLKNLTSQKSCQVYLSL